MLLHLASVVREGWGAIDIITSNCVDQVNQRHKGMATYRQMRSIEETDMYIAFWNVFDYLLIHMIGCVACVILNYDQHLMHVV